MLQNNVSTEMVGSSKNSVEIFRFLTIGQGVSTILISNAMVYLLKMINPLQMIFHLPAFNFGFSSNIMSFFSIIVPIVNYDVLGGFQIYDDFLNSISTVKNE